MTFVDYIKQGIEIAKLNTSALGKVSKDNNATGMAFLFIAIAGACSAIGMFDPVGIIIQPIFMIIAMLIVVGVLHILALIFGGKGTYMGLFKPLGIASVILWIAIIPYVGVILSFLLGIWMIVVEVMAIKTVHQLSTAKSVIVVLIPVIIIFMLLMVLLIVVGLAIFGLGAAGGAGSLSGMGMDGFF